MVMLGSDAASDRLLIGNDTRPLSSRVFVSLTVPSGLACDWRTCEARDLPKFPVAWDVKLWIFGDSSIWLSRSS
jgi:hypothetical protein